MNDLRSGRDETGCRIIINLLLRRTLVRCVRYAAMRNCS
jgi:hypothetical protein